MLLRGSLQLVLEGSLANDSALNLYKSASDLFGIGRGLLCFEDGILASLLWMLRGSGGCSK